MITALYLAYILAWSFKGDQFYGYGPTTKGAESRFIDVVGPEGLSLADCHKYANDRRKAIAIDKKLNSYMQLKFECVPLALSQK